MEDIQRVADVFRNLVLDMVDKPESVRVETLTTELGTMLKVSVAKSDIGKLVGKSGRTARSLRILLQAIGLKNKLRLSLDIEETTC